MNTKIQQPPQSETELSVFDSGAFEQMGMIAGKLAKSSLIPESLKGRTDEQTAANCFRVVEQAQRWGLSPFAVMDSASVVHGKLMWEGKLIHAAITASLGIRLKFSYEGEGDNRKVTVSGVIDDEELVIEGTVGDWKTTGKGSPWDRMANRDQMLAYRGARQWARRHAPEVILGVYSPDEFDDGSIRNVTPSATRAKANVTALTDFKTPSPVGNTQPDAHEEPDRESVSHEEAPRDASGSKQATPTRAGRTKKQRYEQEVTFLDVSAPKTSKGKTWWTIQVQTDKGATVELNTFSGTMSEKLNTLFNGDRIKITFTETPKGGFALESFEEVKGEEVA